MKSIFDFITEKLSLDSNIKINNKDKSDDPTTWEVGDIIYTHWGYSMVIIDYYEIVKATGKSFVVKHLKDEVVSGDGQRGESMPVKGEYEDGGKEIRCRINSRGSVKIDDGYAYLWDGKPKAFDHMD